METIILYFEVGFRGKCINSIHHEQKGGLKPSGRQIKNSKRNLQCLRKCKDCLAGKTDAEFDIAIICRRIYHR